VGATKDIVIPIFRIKIIRAGFAGGQKKRCIRGITKGFGKD
jgi:hypothetical protein